MLLPTGKEYFVFPTCRPYFIEVLSQIQAINIYLRQDNSPVHVFIQPRRILTQCSNGDLNACNLLLNVIPSSCTSLYSDAKQGVGMRLQIQSNDSKLHGRQSQKSSLMPSFKDSEEGYCSCKCKTCDMDLLNQNVLLTSVAAKLPSNHADLSSCWTCCSHTKCDASHRTNVSKSGQMLEDYLSFTFHSADVSVDDIILKQSSSSKGSEGKSRAILCGRCYVLIGQSILLGCDMSTQYSFYKHATHFNLHSSDWRRKSPSVELENVLAKEIAYDVRTKGIYKFLFCDEEDSKYVLMVQVLNDNACLGYHGLGESDEDQSSNLSGKESHSHFVESFSIPWNECSMGQKNDFEAPKLEINCVKVLYASAMKEEGQRLATKWSNNMDVKQLSFPKAICMQALLLLIKSTRIMPVHQTVLNDFMIGFLRFG